MTASVDLRPGRLGTLPLSRLEIRCEHGMSTWFVAPGHGATRNLVALDIARLRHAVRTGCDCMPPVRPQGGTSAAAIAERAQSGSPVEDAASG